MLTGWMDANASLKRTKVKLVVQTYLGEAGTHTSLENNAINHQKEYMTESTCGGMSCDVCRWYQKHHTACGFSFSQTDNTRQDDPVRGHAVGGRTLCASVDTCVCSPRKGVCKCSCIALLCKKRLPAQQQHFPTISSGSCRTGGWEGGGGGEMQPRTPSGMSGVFIADKGNKVKETIKWKL